MTTTLRLFKNQDTDAFKSSGMDLTDYREQLAHDRNSRTLTLRRMKKPTISQFLNQGQRNPLNSPLIDINNFPFLDINYAITQLNNGNTTSLSEFLNSLTVCATTTPRLATSLAQTPDLAEPFVAALMAGYGEPITIQLIRAMIAIFPIAGENKTLFVDSGLTSSLFDFLSSQSAPLLESAVALVCVMADYSNYANNSFLCLGIHEFLIDIAGAEYSEEITLQALDALNRIFSSPVNLANEEKDPIDAQNLTDALEKMVPLLDLSSAQAVSSALLIFVEMTDQMSALVLNIYEFNLFPKIVGFLRVPELISSALPLIGNLSYCQATQADCLLQLGIFDILMELMDSEYIADVFWVLSNLVESIPHKTVNLFNEDFIEQTIDIATRSSFEVKRESTFFLATLIMFVANEDLVYFMNDNILQLMFELLEFNVTGVVLRCIDALIKFAIFIEVRETSDSFTDAFHSEEYIEILNNLEANSDIKLIQERAECLLSKLEGDSSSPLAA